MRGIVPSLITHCRRLIAASLMFVLTAASQCSGGSGGSSTGVSNSGGASNSAKASRACPETEQGVQLSIHSRIRDDDGKDLGRVVLYTDPSKDKHDYLVGLQLAGVPKSWSLTAQRSRKGRSFIRTVKTQSGEGPGVSRCLRVPLEEVNDCVAFRVSIRTDKTYRDSKRDLACRTY